MATQNSATMRRSVSRAEVTNVFLRSVYNWMAAGLGLTAAISFALTYTSLGDALFTTAIGHYIGLGCVIAELVLVFTLSLRINKIEGSTATMLFLAYSALNGVSLSFLLISYTTASVAQAFIVATCMFGAMSLYGLITKRDLTGMGSLLFMGLIGLIIASVVNIFLGSSALEFGISIVGVLIFLGLTAYDTQFLREMGETVPADDATAVRRGAIIGALRLYLDFINIFIMLLRLVGDRR
ncbi:MAG: Bax inhibitor-1/YccA family protein [Desulfovibrio sp.]|jgi:FtsH-binding integral membrane protein|nr:Bax inhibitor-1/YccA family protein [Desulfovibrio sp.]